MELPPGKWGKAEAAIGLLLSMCPDTQQMVMAAGLRAIFRISHFLSTVYLLRQEGLKTPSPFTRGHSVVSGYPFYPCSPYIPMLVCKSAKDFITL
jgi:hypothetical protein